MGEENWIVGEILMKIMIFDSILAFFSAKHPKVFFMKFFVFFNREFRSWCIRNGITDRQNTIAHLAQNQWYVGWRKNNQLILKWNWFKLLKWWLLNYVCLLIITKLMIHVLIIKNLNKMKCFLQPMSWANLTRADLVSCCSRRMQIVTAITKYPSTNGKNRDA